MLDLKKKIERKTVVKQKNRSLPEAVEPQLLRVCEGLKGLIAGKRPLRACIYI